MMEEDGTAASKGMGQIGHFGDLADGDEFVHQSLPCPLPPRMVLGPDNNGLKRTVEYRYDDDGNTVKVTTTTRVRKLARARLSKAAVERRSWAKFGDAASDGERSALTVVSDEEIYLLPTSSASGSSAGGNGGVYVPPKRLAVFYTPEQQDEKVAALRVTNWPENADERDLRDLFVIFGRLRRVSVAVNPRTGRGRGFGIVNFLRKDDAERAMARVNGHRYGHLVLRVGWANEP